MIVENFKQNSPEWDAARLSIPTASSFSSILTPTGKISKSRDPYMAECLAGWYLQRSEKSFAGSYHTERGHELESSAVSYYELETGNETELIGMAFKNEERLVACSPDSLVKNMKRGLEIKCKSAHVHLDYILKQKLPDDFKWQVHGSMWVCDYDEWDFEAYHPDLPNMILTIKRDEALDKIIDEAMNDFIDEMLEKREKILLM